MQYSVSPRFQEKSLGPKPIENFGTYSLRFFAIRKWPSSWTKIDPPKNASIQNMAHRFKNIDIAYLAMEARIKDFAIKLLA